MVDPFQDVNTVTGDLLQQVTEIQSHLSETMI